MPRRNNRRPAKRRPASKIQEAQSAARKQNDSRRKKNEEQLAKVERGPVRPGPLGKTELKAPSGPVTRMQSRISEDQTGFLDGLVKPETHDLQGVAEAGRKISGLVTQHGNEIAAERKKSALADPSLYGSSDPEAHNRRVTELTNYATAQRTAGLRKAGNAVYLGTRKQKVSRRVGGDFEGPETIDVDNIVDKNELLAWLSDEQKVEEIKAGMKANGFDVQSYDDIAKLWKSVVDQAAMTYVTTGKKVTPWALISLRGKQLVGGRPASRTTTSTSFEEMDPAQARLLFEKAAQDHLGRRATKSEVDDFIAKAQTIAKANPNVTRTTTQYGFDGQPVSQTSQSSGGADAAAAQMQVAANDTAMQDEEYGAYQASGQIFGWLEEALRTGL